MDKADQDYLGEQLNTLLDSRIWRVAIQLSLRRSTKQWRKDLLENEALTQERRLGYIYARQALYQGISALYKEVKRQVPDWLTKELCE